MLRSAVLAAALALVAAGGASGEVVARGVQDGLLALNRQGIPSVAYVRGARFVVATRKASGRWTAANAASARAGSSVMAFAIGPAGPVALVQSADDRTLVLVRRQSVGWQTIPLVRGLPARTRLGWPGLAVARDGTVWVGYTRWTSATLDTRLLLARVDSRGRVRTKRITLEGFPRSLVPPPAQPVLVGGRVHVLESYGYRGVLGTLEWFPQRRTWIGLGLDSGVGDFPLGPLLAGISPSGTLHAAWTESQVSYGSAPVTLAARGREASSRFVLDRALAVGLALPSTGPEVAANEWVDRDDVGLSGDGETWAGMIVRGRSSVEVDGWVAGLAVAPRGGRDLLLGGSAGLRWFHARGRLTTRVSIETTDQAGQVVVSGRVRGVASGSVTIYRERPGEPRKALGRAQLSGGAFAFGDRSASAAAVYRAVYVDPASGIPFGALSRP